MRRRFLAWLGLTALLGALGSASCLSPTLPLPPPDVESMTQSSDPDVWNISGTCSRGALVIVFNDETGQGVVYEDRTESGKWFVQLPAEQCDQVWTSQENGARASSRTNFVVDEISPEKPSGSGTCQ